MSRAYSVSGPNASGATNKTLITIVASATVRPRIYDLVIGSNATPADQSAQYGVSRFTAAGTGTSFTPLPLNSSDVAAVATSAIAHSVEPTYTANQTLLTIDLNQRATFRWVASPGMEFVAPATAANGLGLRLISATTTLIADGSVFFFE
jgi:hypothetical protein